MNIIALWDLWWLQTVKNLPAMQETWVQSLGREDPLEKGMATHSSILAWRIPWTVESSGLQSMESPRVKHDCDLIKANEHSHPTPEIERFNSQASPPLINLGSLGK